MAKQPSRQPGGAQTLGIHMRCCNLYIYARLNSQKTAYIGWCPKCASQVRINVVKSGGSTSRFFEAN